MQPLFSTIRSILMMTNLTLELGDSIFGRAKLLGKLLSQIEGLSAVFFSRASSFVK
jgi:hypothetical protein